MKREIKFRAWGDFGKKMHFQTKEEDLWSFLRDAYGMELMQFTGLKDKNGKEIYEGDIFRQEKETDEGDIRNYLVVFWVKQRAAFYLVDACHLSILENNDCSDENEFDWLFQDAALYDFSMDVGLPLVGNIYENPELLK